MSDELIGLVAFFVLIAFIVFFAAIFPLSETHKEMKEVIKLFEKELSKEKSTEVSE